MTPAYAYLRVSGPGQLDGDGFTRQEAAIRTYAQAAGYSIEGVYREEAIPGASDLDSRPAMLQMLEDGESSRVRVVLIEKLDRLARDLMIQEGLFKEFKKCSVSLISAMEPDLQGTDPTRRFIRQVLGAVAELDKALLVARMQSARIRQKEKVGRCEGRKPFGYRPGEAAAFRRIQELRREGLGFDRIAERLNSEQVPTRTGKRWHGVVVNRILRAA